MNPVFTNLKCCKLSFLVKIKCDYNGIFCIFWLQSKVLPPKKHNKNTAIIFDFFLFCFWKLLKCPKHLGLNHHLSTYLNLKGYYIHSRDRSKFWSKMKTRKSQGLLVSCTQVNSSNWQIIATYESRKLNLVTYLHS